MQEENYESTEFMNKSVEDLFLGIQQTYSQAQQRALKESRSFQKTDFFRMDKLGVYRLRILPLAPNKDGSIDRKSYEYPVYQMLLELEKPSAGNKTSFMYVTVSRATEAGYSVDLIDIYRLYRTLNGYYPIPLKTSTERSLCESHAPYPAFQTC